MMLIGVDCRPSFQTIAFFVEETGAYGEQELNHSDGQVEKFYRDLKQQGIGVRVGMEATGHSRWFERLLAELGFGRAFRQTYDTNSIRRSRLHDLATNRFAGRRTRRR